MSKKKKIKQKSKARQPSGSIFGILEQVEMFKSHKGPMTGLAPVMKTGGRAQITGKDYGPSHGKAPLKQVDLMYGKKLIMSGKDKGKII